MREAIRGLVIAGAVAAAAAATVAPATAVTAAATTAKSAAVRSAAAYTNVRLEKVWGPTGRCLSMKGSTGTGAQLTLQKCNADSTQKWTLKGNSSGVYTIKNKKSGKCLSIRSSAAGTRVTQHPCNASAKSQQWVLGSSRIISKQANKVITAKSSDANTYPVIDKYSSAKRKQQEWGLS
ncbi:RICIN domain-containing protein [Streptomyces sp. NBC_01462]|uniref:RICIN domain-containing protein n=1 Tax=Streptomyces sp. NBC_01462 TaxID=2903876 RepID=UPI002E36A4DB|nr:RICIN domain-containing protein [Streptomyces sp. NBC_01462]